MNFVSSSRVRARRNRLVWAAFAIALAAVAVAGYSVAWDIGRSRAIAATRERAEDASTLALAILRGELEKQRALPLILARDPDVRTALADGDRHALDLKLETIAQGTRSAVIYALGRDGVAIAASNWREPTSFVGNDYAFRDYFLGAVTNSAAEQFALGTVSNRPGLYITRRVDGPDGPLGVIVVKVEFDQVEADWRALGGRTLVLDGNGVVILATVAEWRFQVDKALDPVKAAAIRQSIQFGAAPLAPLPLRLEGEVVRGPGIGRNVAARIAVPTTDWRLEVMLPVDRAIRDERADLQTLFALVLMPGAAFAAFALRRRQVNLGRQETQAEVKAELERHVADRTAALAGANARLTEEIEERARAQERLSDAREELAKANRLATLGQVTAGVAHEINQPLTAMRTYAENARAFLGRDDRTAVDSALGKVIGLTERIGSITDTLRGFARRGSGPLVPVDVGEAIAGALMIVDAPLRQAGIVPAVASGARGVMVRARLVELEQVLVNLLRNAVEAMVEHGRHGEPALSIAVAPGDDQVSIAIADRGPGLDREAVEGLFTPFRTTKARGLGLGLTISHDIVAAFGGTLSVVSQPGEGTTFTITLERA